MTGKKAAEMTWAEAERTDREKAATKRSADASGTPKRQTAGGFTVKELDAVFGTASKAKQ
jgi:hypothetical protein